MREIECIQGSPQWFALRRGVPTASCFGRIVTPATGKYAAAAATYMDELTAESLGECVSDFQGSPDTERGHYFEKEALRWLKFRHKVETRQVGFILSDCGRYGASPDAMAGNDPCEVKCPRIKTFLGWLRDYEATGDVPREHKAQVHGEMLVTGANRCHFVAYANSEYLDNLYICVERDEFTEQLGQHVRRFCDELEAWRRKLTGDEYGEIWNTPADPAGGSGPAQSSEQ